jgi:hypothetical protein
VSTPTPLDHAASLLEKGLSPIPVPFRMKGSRTTGWPSLRLTAQDLPQLFGDAPSNMGVLLGEPSGWIVDVDIDLPLALELADAHLPPTGMTWGRASRPRSHRLYRLTAPAESRTWELTRDHGDDGATIVELRSTGCQSLAPGSTHPEDELVRWDDEGEPATIDPAELILRMCNLAGAVRRQVGDEPEIVRETLTRSISPPAHGASNYGREALRREAALVAAAPEGTRNNTLNTAAFKIGTLIAGGEVDHADAESELQLAAQECGLPEGEARRTITSGITAGMMHPRQRQERAPDANQIPRPLVPQPTPPPSPLVFDPISASDLIRDYPDLRPVVIEDLLREGETMNVVASPKTGKSWLVHALALSVASGRPWLGKQTARGRVLLIDAELHKETLASRLHATQQRLGVSTSDMGAMTVCPVRGQRLTIDSIGRELQDRPPGVFRMIILDPLYRFLPPDGEENSNETMTQVYNTLDAIAKHTGASIVVVHHSSKGSQAEKALTDVGSGAGAQSRAADTHLVLRQHECDDAAVVDAVVRSFPPMTPFVIRSSRPGWTLAPDLDPTLLKKPGRAGRRSKAETPASKATREWTPEEFAREVVGRSRSIRDEILARAQSHGLSKGKSDSLLKRTLESKLVHRHQDSPSSTHRFSIDPPTGPAGEGRRVGADPAPGALAPGGVGGRARPPSPPVLAKSGGASSSGKKSCDFATPVVDFDHGPFDGRDHGSSEGEQRDAVFHREGRGRSP